MKVRCLSCGKTYDYLKTDLCPKCGAYNSPSDSQRHSLDQQILRERGYECNPNCMPQGYGGHSHSPSGGDDYRTAAGSRSTQDAKRLENSQASNYDAQATRKRERRPSSSQGSSIIPILIALAFLLFSWFSRSF